MPVLPYTDFSGGRIIPQGLPPAKVASYVPAVIPFNTAAYSISATTLEQCPSDTGLEVAFVGRSNAGKSSAINMLTGQHKLARTSKTPGRTQLLNFFTLGENRFLVDLPGFGYAKVPPAMKRKWQQQLERYLRLRKSLKGLVLLMDIRHPFKDSDETMLTWCLDARLPLHILLTKSDKLKHGAARAALLQARKQVAEHADLVSVQLFSSVTGAGADELRLKLSSWLSAPAESTTSGTTSGTITDTPAGTAAAGADVSDDGKQPQG